MCDKSYGDYYSAISKKIIQRKLPSRYRIYAGGLIIHQVGRKTPSAVLVVALAIRPPQMLAPPVLALPH